MAQRRCSAQTPPPSVFWVVGDGGGTWGAHGRKVALPPCRAAPLGCSATTLGACFIGPYQKGPTNAETQRSYPDFFVRRNGRLSKAESAQARATDRVFSRHLLARACKAPRLYRPPLMCEPPSNPTSNLSPAALFAPTIGPAQSLLTARESHVLHLLACAGMAVNTHMVSILNKRSCCWVLQLRPRSDFGRLVHPRSKRLGGGRTLSDRARRVLHL